MWINDANLGRFVPSRANAFYDVTDDWRLSDLTDRERRRLIKAEDHLARTFPTIVCSEVLQSRWRDRYGVDPRVVPNAADVDAIRAARSLPLGDDGPHIGYVGTLHDVRLDARLVCATADALESGTVHLVGPNHLSPAIDQLLGLHPRIRMHGPVAFDDVPSWLASFDVLICPHLVSEFTLSLDAIKAHEYLATRLPVVATPSSGFQDIAADGLVVTSDDFAAVVAEAATSARRYDRSVPSWDDRAVEFYNAIRDSSRSGP